MADPTLDRIVVYPVKSLNPVSLERAEVLDAGGLSFDREYAMVDADGNYVNGKNDRRVHRLRSSFAPETGTLALRPCDGEADDATTFTLPDDLAAASDWLSEFFGEPVELRRDDAGGFPDRSRASGPTVIAESTLAEVASWFDGVDAAEMRRRLRPNLVVSGVPAFWEDRLYAAPGSAVAFDVGGARFEGTAPCQRCVVPTRDPDTGERTEGFRERFVEKRRETLPAWANRDQFDHYFRLMVTTAVPRGTVGETLRVGDPVEIIGEVPAANG